MCDLCYVIKNVCCTILEKEAVKEITKACDSNAHDEVCKHLKDLK